MIKFGIIFDVDSCEKNELTNLIINIYLDIRIFQETKKKLTNDRNLDLNTQNYFYLKSSSFFISY